MKKERKTLLLSVAVLLCLLGLFVMACGAGEGGVEQTENMENTALDSTETLQAEQSYGLDDAYRTYYEIFVHSFYDSDGDGIGDLKGLDEKLDYLNDADVTTTEDLGVNGIWLMPIMPSTTYHKYDVIDYMAVDPEYGTMEDFAQLMTDCRERDIDVIIDFVMNHTSSHHPWFVRACEYLQSIGEAEPDPAACPYVEYYNFSREKKAEYYVQVPKSSWYYEAKFWSEMPDLNLKNEAVRAEFEQITQFWIDQGVAGFRLDAAKEYESDFAAENIAILTWFQDMVKTQKEDAYIVAEVWTDIDTYAPYYGSGIDSVFNFEFADSTGIIASSLKRASGYNASSYAKAVSRLEEKFAAYNPDYIDAPFYTNHDMARSAGYYSGEYSPNQTKLAGAMNLLMNGSAFLYYGEELGMKGAGKDENKRLAFRWEADEAAAGTCKSPQGSDSVKQKYGSLAEQMQDETSIYQFYKKVIQVRNKYPQIARGTVTWIEEASGEEVCVIKKTWQDSAIYLVYNLSEKAQQVRLPDLQKGGSGQALELADGLTSTAEEITLGGDGTLSMPCYSVAVLK